VSDTVTTRGKDQVLRDAVRVNPVDVAQYAFRRKLLLSILGIVLLLAVLAVVRRFLIDRPVAYANDEEHYKYGSIGAEPGGSIFHAVGGTLPPAKIFAVLPDMFPDKLAGGYASLGLVFEPGHDLPIGVSERRRLGIDWAGFNCAVCHVGTVRTSENAPRKIIAGMPSHQLDLQKLFQFVIGAILDPRFNADDVRTNVERRFGAMGLVDRALLGTIVSRVKSQTAELQRRVGILFGDQVTAWGPGRVDTFNPYKALQFNWDLARLPAPELSAACDFPALWNQGVRTRMNLHWDGNNASLEERNLSAGLGAGITPVTADHDAIGRVRAFSLGLEPPPWPSELPIDRIAASKGAGVYGKYCAACHDLEGPMVGTVLDVGDPKLGTDPQRLVAYTREFADNQNTLFPDSPHRFTHFRKTTGYANQPLDGIWARAPYLHNGSVPTLRDLLMSPAQRPVEFYRGCDLFDPVKVGFRSDIPSERGRDYFKYDTKKLGNSNAGHLWGTDLKDEDRSNLLEYLKTL
jgi:hypothetical protein